MSPVSLGENIVLLLLRFQGIRYFWCWNITTSVILIFCGRMQSCSLSSTILYTTSYKQKTQTC